MAKVTGLRKGLINIHSHASLDSRFLSPLRSHPSTMKLSSIHSCSILSKRIDEPTTYVTQETIDEANRDDSAPVMPSAKECCGEGCQNCVWLEYVYKIKFFYKHDKTQIQVALSQIPCSDTKAFVEFELRKRSQKGDTS